MGHTGALRLPPTCPPLVAIPSQASMVLQRKKTHLLSLSPKQEFNSIELVKDKPQLTEVIKQLKAMEVDWS